MIAYSAYKAYKHRNDGKAEATPAGSAQPASNPNYQPQAPAYQQQAAQAQPQQQAAPQQAAQQAAYQPR